MKNITKDDLKAVGGKAVSILCVSVAAVGAVSDGASAAVGAVGDGAKAAVDGIKNLFK